MATQTQLSMFESYRCADAEPAITGSLPMAGTAALTIDTDVDFVIEVGEHRYPLIGRVSKPTWTRRLDKDSGEVYAVPRTTISITPDPVE